MSMREWPDSGYPMEITDENLAKIGFTVPEEYEDLDDMCRRHDMLEDNPLVLYIRKVYGFDPTIIYADSECFTIEDFPLNTWLLIFGEDDKYKGVSPCKDWKRLTKKIQIFHSTWTVFS